MNITPITTPTFTSYQSPLKTYWKQGKLKDVKYGFYGDKITYDNFSLEHLRPHSAGGPTRLWNLVIASKDKNRGRGNSPLKDFVNIDIAKRYLSQFKDVDLPELNGKHYIKLITETLKKFGINL